MSDFFDRPIVCNTGPLIGLSRAGLGDLLARLFTQVLLPEAVLIELRAKPSRDSIAIEQAISQAQIVQLSHPPDRMLQAELDVGEAAVIQLAIERAIPNVLPDERRGRRVASAIYGLGVKGTCGLLLEAKRRQLITQVRSPLAAMLAGGYFIGPQLVAECLLRASE
jgi:predicted nucleic acid-binding protein